MSCLRIYVTIELLKQDLIDYSGTEIKSEYLISLKEEYLYFIFIIKELKLKFLITVFIYLT